jgi:type II secretory pathway component PulF
MIKFVVDYVTPTGAQEETVIRADSEEEAIELFEARNPTYCPVMVYEKEGEE